MNAIKKRYIYLTSLSRKIQNGRHEITKVIISSVMIEMGTRLFHQAIRFRCQGMQYNKRDFYFKSYHAKFKMAAMKSLNHKLHYFR